MFDKDEEQDSSMVSRRDFLKRMGLAGAGALIGSPNLRSLPGTDPCLQSRKNALESDYPFPYDSSHFEAAERVVFTDPLTADINIIPKEGMSLDINIRFIQEDRFRLLQSSFLSYSSVNDSLHIPFKNVYKDPYLNYRIEYKSVHESNWRSTPVRTVKTPVTLLSQKDIEIIMISDDHFPDDADSSLDRLQDEYLRQIRLTGESVNYFLEKLLVNPDYERDDQERFLFNAYCLASFIRHVYLNESPDFIVNLGDHHGGFGHKWEGLGLLNQFEVTDEERDAYTKIFRLATRKIFSALSPFVPIYWSLGNHDGEPGFHGTKDSATVYRKKYFRLPGEAAGNSPDENYYSLHWGADEGRQWLGEERRGGVQFIVLDCMRYNPRRPQKLEEWTLGEAQRLWFENSLKYDAEWKFVLYHHVLGGWPAGSSEDTTNYHYGRGPLFREDDYRDFLADPGQVEQVHLTRLMEKNGVDINFYGHDHIFFLKEIESQRLNRKLYGACVGSPKYVGEFEWYKGEFWQKYYGDYGAWGGEAQEADFWGPAGYTKLTVQQNSLRLDYIRSAFNHPHTNLPETMNVGDVVRSVFI